MQLLFLVGLTGVGKSTILPTLLAGDGEGARLLPDRRTLTDEIILPAALALDDRPQLPVVDRLERFRLTARYREAHPEGIVHALHEHLETKGGAGAIFDGLRGVVEVRAADLRFPGSRFLMLEGRVETRVARLLGRADRFDRRVGQREGEPARAAERAERIVAEEQRHYDQAGARRYLQGLPERRRLIIDTDSLAQGEVTERVQEWL